jgi:FlaA1/EpsC-like NDP-sugar epimerase
MLHFNLEHFISEHVTGRTESMFATDIEANQELLARRIDGKSVLVIGGAGSIGSSYIRALLRFRPGRLVVVDINENGLTELTLDLRSSEDLNVPDTYLTYPINFGNPVFEKIIRNEGPFDIVANFAAHKHVRSEKDQYSIEAMVDNNVLKAKQLLDLLLEFPPQHFFCVSTDKAANPVNVMGASKKLMEEVILSYSTRIPITTARFANVAFSNGSLPAGFLERLMKRQPLSAPSDVKRYFVSPEESGQICLLACMLGHSGEIFFPKLEEAGMKRFSDIGTALLRSMGYEPMFCTTEQEARQAAANLNGQSTWPVYYFPSDTSGEKDFEEFYTEEEVTDLERFRSLGVIRNAPKKDFSEIEIMFQSLSALFARDFVSKEDIVQLLADFIPNFEHIETGKNLDGKM